MSLDYKQKYLKYKKKYLELKEQSGGKPDKLVFRNSVYVDGRAMFPPRGRGPDEKLKELIEEYPNYKEYLTQDEFKFLLYIMFGANYESAKQSYWRAIFDSCTKANDKVSPELCSNDLQAAKRIITSVEAKAKNQVKKGKRVNKPVYGISDWTPFIPAEIVEIYVDKSKLPKAKKKSFMKKLSSFTKSKEQKEAEKKHQKELADKATKDATMYRVKIKGKSYWFDGNKEESEDFIVDDSVHPLHELHSSPGQFYNNNRLQKAADVKKPKVGDKVFVPYTEDWDDDHKHHIYWSQARSDGNEIFLTFFPEMYVGVLNGFHMQLAQIEKSINNSKKRGEGEAPEAPQVISNMNLPPVAQKN